MTYSKSYANIFAYNILIGSVFFLINIKLNSLQRVELLKEILIYLLTF